MNFDLLRLLNNIDKTIPVDIIYSFKKEELEGTDLISLDNVKINGEIVKDSLDNICVNLTVQGVMVLECAVTLKPVDYPFNIEISGNIEELTEEIDKKDTNFQNSIDIFPIIWENILLEIPMRVVSEEAKDVKLSGDGWKLITDEEELTSSPFSGLKDLLNDREVR